MLSHDQQPPAHRPQTAPDSPAPIQSPPDAPPVSESERPGPDADYRRDPVCIYIGVDARQIASYTVCTTSLYPVAKSRPIHIVPLLVETIPIQKFGLTPFTYARWLVPWMQQYQGYAIFCDPDAIFRGDPAELIDIAMSDPSKAVWVVPQSDPERKFEEPAIMVFNCGHQDCQRLTPEFVNRQDTSPFKLQTWTGHIGTLPPQWHNLILYEDPRPDAKWVHFTGGVPAREWPTFNTPFTDEWHKLVAIAMHLRPWEEILGNSKHRERVERHAASQLRSRFN